MVLNKHQKLLLHVFLSGLETIRTQTESQQKLSEVLAPLFSVEEAELCSVSDDIETCVASALSLALPSEEQRRRFSVCYDRGLVPVFENVFLPSETSDVENDRDFTENYRYKMRVLDVAADTELPSVKDLVFPVVKDEAAEVNYDALWEQLLSEAALLPKGDFHSTFDSLYFLLQKYTCFVPSLEYPDIPLFDLLRTTAAIASSLLLGEATHPCLFVYGDLSGIQNFIYKVNSPQEADPRTSVRLRGRSFYISLFVETVIQYLLKQLGLFQTHLLWCEGGNFLLLAPNAEESRAVVSQTSILANRFLLNKFRGDLYLNLVAPPAEKEILSDFSSIIDALGYSTSREKQQKYLSLLCGKDWDFKLGIGVCAVCERDTYPGEIERLCDECDLHGNIGRRLVQINSLILLHSDGKIFIKQGEPNRLIIPFNDFEIYWRFNTIGNLGGTIKRAVTYTINNTQNFLAPSVGAASFPISRGYRFMANAVAKSVAKSSEGAAGNSDKQIEEGVRPTTFDELAQSSNGISRLGVLRMDVDDLGATFSFGLEPVKTISRCAALSRAISLFFSLYLDALCRSKNLYITYAGGDDLFITGAWNEVIDIASQISKDFETYTCHNEHLHISGGLFLAREKFPIRRSAILAGENLESEAKKQKGKDSFNLFGQSLSFREFGKKDEPNTLMTLISELKEQIETRKIQRSFIYKLRRIYAQSYIDGQVREMEWRFRYIRLLSRDLAEQPEFRQMLLHERQVYLMMKYTPIITSYISYALRR